MAGLHRQVVDPDGIDDDPHDREEPEGGTEQPAVHGVADRHGIRGHRHYQGDGEPDDRRKPCTHAHDTEQHEQRDQGQGCHDRGQSERIAERVIDLPVIGEHGRTPS